MRRAPDPLLVLAVSAFVGILVGSLQLSANRASPPVVQPDAPVDPAPPGEPPGAPSDDPFERRGFDLLDCYGEWQEAQPDVTGLVEVRLMLGPADAGTSAIDRIIVMTDGAAKEELERCLLGHLHDVRVAPPLDGGRELRRMLGFGTMDGG